MFAARSRLFVTVILFVSTLTLAADAQRHRDVLPDREPGQQRRLLDHHADLGTGGACNPAACAPTAIRKANIALTGRNQNVRSRTSVPGDSRKNFFGGFSMKSSCSMKSSRPNLILRVPAAGSSGWLAASSSSVFPSG